MAEGTRYRDNEILQKMTEMNEQKRTVQSLESMVRQQMMQTDAVVEITNPIKGQVFAKKIWNYLAGRYQVFLPRSIPSEFTAPSNLITVDVQKQVPNKPQFTQNVLSNCNISFKGRQKRK